MELFALERHIKRMGLSLRILFFLDAMFFSFLVAKSFIIATKYENMSEMLHMELGIASI